MISISLDFFFFLFITQASHIQQNLTIDQIAETGVMKQN